MSETKQYWKGLEQLSNTPDFQERANKEFAEYLPIKGGGENDEPSRRDFLKMMGFSVAAASLAACEAPIRKAIPYVNKPVDVDPSVPNYYASTYVNGSDVASIVVKTREGRPIKIDCNALSPFGSGTNAQMEASVLSLYDQHRLRGPMANGEKTSWEDIDQKIKAGIASSKKVTLVSHTVSSPSTQKTIDALIAANPTMEHVSYDAVSMSGSLDAYEVATGKRAVPLHDFSKAKTIVSFGADFLATWPNAELHQKQFTSRRQLRNGVKEMSRLYAFEANLTITGSNADYRTPIRPSEEAAYVANLLKMLGGSVNAPAIEDKINLEKAVKDLKASNGEAVVVAGSNDEDVQTMVIAINQILGSYGSTIDLSKSVNTRKGDDKEMKQFISELKSGATDGVIFYNCNPVYEHPLGEDIKAALAKAKLSVSTSDRNDETTENVQYLAPDHHFLESWNDFELVTGHFSLSQPTIRNIFDTRQAQDSFMNWAGAEGTYLESIQKNWQDAYASAEGDYIDFQNFWDKVLQDGIYLMPSTDAEALVVNADVSQVKVAKPQTSGYELAIYQSNAIGDGAQSNNPWLQEMPDPISRACWDNYLTISPIDADGVYEYESGRMVAQVATLTVGDKKIDVPVLPQPGQKRGTLGLALGYGRSNAGQVADGVGVNAYNLVDVSGNALNFSIANVSLSEPVGTQQVAQTQTSQTVMERGNVLQEATLKEFQKDPFAGAEGMKITSLSGKKHPYAVTLWEGHEYANHHWGMAVDLNSCIGCGACVVACSTENNIPVVGKQEVINRREMHWIRIDRYFSHNPDDLTESQKNSRSFTKPEFAAAENPEVTFQPMMCQQCNAAPCETVCPVAATTHSSEGLNQMTYNRCVGTRYCANNCPYKVRRFNWFKYHDNEQFSDNLAMNNDLGKMVLNPDVTVRSRGVMEKCTFCVQSIQAGKLQARREGRRPKDSDFVSACSAACSTGAITFGDMKDKDSKISELLSIEEKPKMVEAKNPRAYHVLEELKVMPNVWYLRKIRNKDENKAEA